MSAIPNLRGVVSVHAITPQADGFILSFGKQTRQFPQGTPEGVSILFNSAEAAGTAFQEFRDTPLRSFRHSWGHDNTSTLSNHFVDVIGSPSRIMAVLQQLVSAGKSNDELARRGELWFKKAHCMPISMSEIQD